MANSYFSSFKKPVALSLTSLAWARLSSAFNFQASGSRSNSLRVTVYSTVAFGGILNASLPFSPNAYSGLITNLQKTRFNLEFQIVRSDSKFELTTIWAIYLLTSMFHPFQSAWALSEYQKQRHRPTLLQWRMSNHAHRIHVPRTNQPNELKASTKTLIDFRTLITNNSKFVLTSNRCTIIGSFSCGWFFDDMSQNTAVGSWT